ncbi:hypothetical protein C1645_831906 [Glomus cerebriforme]|uniref:DUF659 domain-containing protein n=1 Tax=Glomus cerebriforme TaxID=658196 RepID=A0A397SPW8_9GLOM|nr:hypothetical protein C1645_831906 [Glomus cerebriforme]
MDSQAFQSFATSFHKVIIQSSSYGPMDNFIVRFLSKEDLRKFYILLIRLTVSCGWALSWVNNPEDRDVEKVDDIMEIALKEDPVAVDISIEHENYINVMEKIESMLTELEQKEINVCAIVTDSAGAYAAARLRISIRSVVFLPCKIFKESTEFKVTVDHSTKLATYFQNLNNKFFIAQLKELQYEIYEKHIIPIVSVETRWNSIYEMCLSLIKTQQALQMLAIKFKPPIIENHHNKDRKLTISHAIFEIIDSNNFWDNLVLLTEILDPYCKILNILQSDKARLFQLSKALAMNKIADTIEKNDENLIEDLEDSNDETEQVNIKNKFDDTDNITHSAIDINAK